ncbi:MAG TPA: hypothetical protein VNR42_03840 [Solirubrobacteraceae bacterium]|nr:hypothetical protein [Solirubrobacteraceae bacterium]
MTTTPASACSPEITSSRIGPPAVAAHAADRDHLLDRLHNLRMIVPVFAQELASARRQAAALRVENRKLRERVQQLQRTYGSSHVRGREQAP